jgi:hypothetical protein
MILRLLVAFLVCTLSALAQRGLKDIPDPDPVKQKQAFNLPEGMQIELFASDPMIAKPVQMNFDTKGRLWLVSSGMYPHIAHGEALAMVYPAFARFTQAHEVHKFAKLARMLNPDLTSLSDEEAAVQSAEEISKFLQILGLNYGLKDAKVPENELEALATQCMVLPDYKGNPRVATEAQMLEMLKESY